MDVAELRKRILRELDKPAPDRRAAADASRQGFAGTLHTVIVPLLKQTASILNAEGALCRVHTPSDTARLAFDRSPEDFIEFMLDSTPPAHVIARASVRRKGGTHVEDHVIGAGREIAEISEEDVLAFLLPQLRKTLRQ